jgi:hypothetical protein
MKNITRTLKVKVFTAIAVKYIDGKMEEKSLPDFKTSERISKVGVEKHFKEELNDDSYSIVITGQNEETKNYEIPLETFLKYATEIKKPAEKENSKNSSESKENEK